MRVPVKRLTSACFLPSADARWHNYRGRKWFQSAALTSGKQEKHKNVGIFKNKGLVSLKDKMQLISLKCKFGLLCGLIVIEIIQNFTLCHNWISGKLHGTDIHAMTEYLYSFEDVEKDERWWNLSSVQQQSWDAFSDYPRLRLKKTHRNTSIQKELWVNLPLTRTPTIKSISQWCTTQNKYCIMPIF